MLCSFLDARKVTLSHFPMESVQKAEIEIKPVGWCEAEIEHLAVRQHLKERA